MIQGTIGAQRAVIIEYTYVRTERTEGENNLGFDLRLQTLILKHNTTTYFDLFRRK